MHNFTKNYNFAANRKCNFLFMSLRIKEILKEKGLSQKDLAKLLNVTDVTISKILNGSPTLTTLEKIAAALGVEVSELFAPSCNVIRCPHCGAVLEISEKK